MTLSRRPPPEDLEAARGLLLGALFSVVIWALTALTVWELIR